MAYQLQKYNGRKTRHECPSCHRQHCFALYVNDDGKALSPEVGRCDHQNSCGYHLKPKEFFADHPTLRIPPSWEKPMAVEKDTKLWTIPDNEVRRFRSDESTLVKWMRGILGRQITHTAAAMYQLGALADGSTIYWQIDMDGKVRTAKVMAYGEDGHRIKNPDNDRITWMHALLKKDGILPHEWELTQCLFGEHLLRAFPDAPVALVESEKTAVIMSMLNPEYLWLATGGKYNFNGARLSALNHRRVYLYPDADATREWADMAVKCAPLYDIRVCDLHYTADDIANKRDIADLAIQKLLNPNNNETLQNQ